MIDPMKVPDGFDDIIAADADSFPKQDGNEAAAMLFLTYRHYVKAIALRFVPFPHLADEIVQQVFVVFLEKAPTLDLSQNIKAFLAVTAQNIAKKYWRDESKHFKPEMQRVAEYVRQILVEPNPDSYPDELDALQRCLEKAPEKARHLIQLHYFGRVPINEIARQMELSAEAVYKAFFRLREKLRLCIDNAVKGDESHV